MGPDNRIMGSRKRDRRKLQEIIKFNENSRFEGYF
jgi:hypothetical protein